MNRGSLARASIGLVSVALLSACGAELSSIVGYDRAFDATGSARLGAPRLSVRWTHALTPDHEGPYLPIERAVPVFDPDRDRIFVGSSAGALWAFTSGGTALWMYEAGGSIGSGAYYDPRRQELFFASDDGLLHALNAETAEPRWRAEVGSAVGRTPVATDDAVYLVTDADMVMAFDRSNGEVLWRYQRETPDGFYVTEHAGLTFSRGSSQDLLLTGFTDGVVVALDPRDGSILWERDTTSDLPPTDTLRFTDVDTTPVVVAETVYVASFAGGLFALSRSSGTVEWLRDDLTGVVAIAEGPGDRLILASGDLGVVSVRKRDGETEWRTPVGRGAPTTPVLVDDLVVVGETEGGLLALSVVDGREISRIENGHGFAAPLRVEHGLGAVVSNAGRLFVLAVD